MKNGYGLGEIIKNTISLIYTKIFFKDARLIRRPIYIRGKKFLGMVRDLQQDTVVD